MLEKEIKTTIASLRKVISSKKIKFTHDTLFGTVNVEYIDKSPKTQKLFQSLKEAFKLAGMSVVYRGSSFSFTYKTMEDVNSQMRAEALSFLNTLR
jgi:DNA/RNA endonuclease YhcR with UshA esterase domain